MITLRSSRSYILTRNQHWLTLQTLRGNNFGKTYLDMRGKSLSVNFLNVVGTIQQPRHNLDYLHII